MDRTARYLAGLLASSALVCVSAPAWAQSVVSWSVDRQDAATRILITYDESLGDDGLTASAEMLSNVVVAEFSQPIVADLDGLVDEIGDIAAMARVDPDGRRLRIAMRSGVEPVISTSYNVIAIDLVPPGSPTPEPVISPRAAREQDAARRAAEQAASVSETPVVVLDPVPVSYRIGQSAEYTRIEFLWAEPVNYTLSQSDDDATVTFSLPAQIALGQLAGSPPRFLDAASGERQGNEYVLSLDLAPGVAARVWGEGNRVVVDLPDPTVTPATEMLEELASAYRDANTPDEPEDEPEPIAYDPLEGRDDPVPEDGVVNVAVNEANGDVFARFNWSAPVGAAVFRRGEAIWAVFDAEAELNLDALGQTRRGQVRSFETVTGEGFVAARIVTAPSIQAEARLDGDLWTLVFSERIEAPPRPLGVRRDARRGRKGRIVLDLEGAQAARWVDDPVVGDRIAVITARGPVQGLTSQRDFVALTLLPSAHGAAATPYVDDLQLELIGQGAVLERPSGLTLSPGAAGSSEVAAASVANLSSAAFMDFEAWAGHRRFNREWPARQRRTAIEEGPDGRMALARFLLANDLAAEALGMLETAIEIEPELANDSHVRALRGVASYGMHRLEDAEEYLSDPTLNMDPAALMWRGLVSARQEKWEEARRQLEAGDEAVFHYTSPWRGHIRVAQARTALELNDLSSASAYLRLAEQEDMSEETALDAEYVKARMEHTEGQTETAIQRLDQIAHSGFEPQEARALLEMYSIQMEAGLISRTEAIDALENLRFRWRGDSIELETVRRLGQLYIEDGAYSQGLETMATARARYPESEAARRIGDEMANVFERLFLQGQADRMAPIEAVALFYQYQELTPIGADGDRMIRRLADRLIAFNLLRPASELLQHQVDYRLREPVARARVATDLAVIYLMDRRYEDALNTLLGSRVAGMPDALRAERYLLEARARAELGYYDGALEIIERDRSDGANRLRADIAWDRQDWAATGRRLEALLNDRWRDPSPLTPSEQTDLIRAAIAYSLNSDLLGAQRLGQRYGAAMARTEQAAAFEVLTRVDNTPGDVRFSDLASHIASIDTLDSFMEPFRARFQGGGES